MAKGQALKGLRSDYVVAIAASASVALVSVGLFGWISRALGAETLGYFSQLRRVTAQAVPIGTLCLGMALGRYVPRLGSARSVRLRALQVLALVLATFCVLAVALPALEGRGWLHPVIGDRSSLLQPFMWQLAGLCSLVLPYTLLRGLRRFRSAALMQVVGYALWPLAAVAWSIDAGLEVMMTRIGLGQTLWAAMVYGVALAWIRVEPVDEPEAPFGAWVGYSALRLPAGAANFVLWSFLPMLLIAWGHVTEAALANAVLSLVNIPLLILAPLAFVLLPRLSLAQVQGDDEEVRQFLARGLRTIWELHWPVTVVVALVLERFLLLWLDFDPKPFLAGGRWMVASIPAVAVFMFLRPALDARALRPHALIAQAAGLVVGAAYVLLRASERHAVDAAVGFWIAQTVAAVLAFWSCWRLHDMAIGLPLRRVADQSAPLLIGAIGIAYLGAGPAGLALLLVACLAYLWRLYRTESPWLVALASRVRRGPS